MKKIAKILFGAACFFLPFIAFAQFVPPSYWQMAEGTSYINTNPTGLDAGDASHRLGGTWYFNAVDATTLAVSGTLTGDLDFAGNDAVNVGNISGYSTGSGGDGFVNIGSCSSTHTLTGTNDLVICGNEEINGTTYFDGNAVLTDTTLSGDKSTAGYAMELTQSGNGTAAARFISGNTSTAYIDLAWKEGSAFGLSSFSRISASAYPIMTWSTNSASNTGNGLNYTDKGSGIMLNLDKDKAGKVIDIDGDANQAGTLSGLTMNLANTGTGSTDAINITNQDAVGVDFQATNTNVGTYPYVQIGGGITGPMAFGNEQGIFIGDGATGASTIGLERANVPGPGYVSAFVMKPLATDFGAINATLNAVGKDVVITSTWEGIRLGDQTVDTCSGLNLKLSKAGADQFNVDCGTGAITGVGTIALTGVGASSVTGNFTAANLISTGDISSTDDVSVGGDLGVTGDSTFAGLIQGTGGTTLYERGDFVVTSVGVSPLVDGNMEAAGVGAWPTFGGTTPTVTKDADVPPGGGTQSLKMVNGAGEAIYGVAQATLTVNAEYTVTGMYKTAGGDTAFVQIDFTGGPQWGGTATTWTPFSFTAHAYSGGGNILLGGGGSHVGGQVFYDNVVATPTHGTEQVILGDDGTGTFNGDVSITKATAGPAGLTIKNTNASGYPWITFQNDQGANRGIIRMLGSGTGGLGDLFTIEGNGSLGVGLWAPTGRIYGLAGSGGSVRQKFQSDSNDTMFLGTETSSHSLAGAGDLIASDIEANGAIYGDSSLTLTGAATIGGNTTMNGAAFVNGGDLRVYNNDVILASVGSNPIVDADMEAVGTAAWTPFNAPVLTKDADAHSGVQSLKMQDPGSVPNYSVAQFAILNVGQQYTVTGWYKTDGVANFYSQIDFTGGPQFVGTAAVWTAFSYTATATVGAISFGGGGGGAGTYVLVDDVSALPVLGTDTVALTSTGQGQVTFGGGRLGLSALADNLTFDTFSTADALTIYDGGYATIGGATSAYGLVSPGDLTVGRLETNGGIYTDGSIYGTSDLTLERDVSAIYSPLISNISHGGYNPGSAFRFIKSSGTKASPGANNLGDVIGATEWQGYSGDNTITSKPSAGIYGYVEDLATSQVSMGIGFGLSDGTANPYDTYGMFLHYYGDLGIGTDYGDTQGRLHVRQQPANGPTLYLEQGNQGVNYAVEQATVNTTDATQTTLLDIPLDEFTTYQIEARVLAAQTSGGSMGDSGSYVKIGTFKSVNTAVAAEANLAGTGAQTRTYNAIANMTERPGTLVISNVTDTIGGVQSTETFSNMANDLVLVGDRGSTGTYDPITGIAILDAGAGNSIDAATNASFAYTYISAVQVGSTTSVHEEEDAAWAVAFTTFGRHVYVSVTGTVVDIKWDGSMIIQKEYFGAS